MNQGLHDRLRHGRWWAALAACWLGCLASDGEAQTIASDVVRLPAQRVLPSGQLSPQTASRSGLELEVDTRWLDSYGYRPLRFTFQSTRRATSDYQITVRFYADDWTDHEFSLAVEQDAELKTGERSVTMILRTPQLDTWNFGRWDVWVDGLKEPALSLDRVNAMNFNRWQQGGLNILIPAPALKIANQRSTNPMMGPFFAGVQINRLHGPLPVDWLDYSCFDVVAMTLDELVAESRSHPDRMAALRRWIHAGGNLWIEDTGAQPERLLMIDELMQLDAPAMPLNRESVDETLPPGWAYATFRRPAGMNEDQLDRSNDESPPETILRDLPEELSPFPFEPAPSTVETPDDSRDWFVERTAGFGVVTAYVSQWNDSPDHLGRMTRYIAAMRWYQRSWLPRHGLAPNVPNAEFANWLIPDVGLAPVTEFRVLITIFVLLIGPLNYWVLSRAKRLYLLVLTVPLGAAAVTLLLFAYAFLADGLSTQLRARSLTYLDQPSGESVSWSRLSYYAGFAPAGGLSFPVDTAIYPILPENQGWNSRWRRSGRVVLWRDEQQDFTRGWLPARTPTQYLAVRAHETSARLEVRSASDRCQVANDLGAPLKWLLVIDEAGSLWHATNIEPEQRLELHRIAIVDAVRYLRESLVENKPQLPAELQAAGNSQSPSGRNRWRRGRFRFMGNAGEFRLSSNLLEKNLEELGGLSGAAKELDFAPRTYLAQATTAVDTPLGLDDAEEVASYHLIIGRW